MQYNKTPMDQFDLFGILKMIQKPIFLENYTPFSWVFYRVH